MIFLLLQITAERLSLEFVDFTLCEKDVKYSIDECKERDATYAAPLKVKVRLHNKETDEINEHEIFYGRSAVDDCYGYVRD